MEKLALTKEEMILFLSGYFACLDDYSIWNDGVQRIGAMRMNINDIKDIMLKDASISREEIYGRT